MCYIVSRSEEFSSCGFYHSRWQASVGSQYQHGSRVNGCLGVFITTQTGGSFNIINNNLGEIDTGTTAGVQIGDEGYILG